MNRILREILDKKLSKCENFNKKLEFENLIESIHCRLEDWERSFRQMHPNRVADVSHLITELHLSNLNLTMAPPREFLARLPNLNSLWLRHNCIEDLQNAFQDCKRLKELRLGTNRLTSIRGQLKNLHCLEVLDLSYNFLIDREEIIAELAHMHFLKELDFTGSPASLLDQFRQSCIVGHPSLQIFNRSALLPGEYVRLCYSFKTPRPSRVPHLLTNKTRHNENRLLVRETTNLTSFDECDGSNNQPISQDLFMKKLVQAFERKTITNCKLMDWSKVVQNREQGQIPTNDVGTFLVIEAQF